VKDTEFSDPLTVSTSHRDLGTDFLTRVIDFSLRYRGLVILAYLGIVVAGLLALRELDIDAFPDITPVQVQINTVAPALGPEEIERQITMPIEQELGGLARVVEIRSLSRFGLSQVVLNFEDGTDIYWARQQVDERLDRVELPEGIARPTLGPIATGLGEVLHYLLMGNSPDPTDLRTVQDWVVKPVLRSVPGTAEVNSWGGYVKQYEVRVDPQKLLKFGITFDQLTQVIRQSNLNVGGGQLTSQGGTILVQGLGRTVDLNQIREIPIATAQGVPIRLGDLGEVAIGHEIRRGAVTAMGEGEAVLGLGFMLMGENSHRVTRDMRAKLETVAAALPPNIQLVVVYDRTELVDWVIDTVKKNLFEGGLLVVAVLFAFLGNLRAALIVALAIPLSMLFAFSGMWRFGIAASLLSLGAIDFGLIVDSSVVLVENCARHLSRPENSRKSRLQIVRQAAMEVRRPTLFGELIIMIVYLPILTLEGVEGKLFRPMALTVIFALAGSMLLSLTLMPALASFVLPRGQALQEPLLMRLVHRLYRPVLRFSMEHKWAVLGIAVALLVIAFGMIAPNLGTEFVPRLSEGALAISVVRLAGTDLSESIRLNTIMERSILENFPDEVQYVWSRVGTAEVATDPMGIEVSDLFITLHPRHQWKKARTQEEFIRKLDAILREWPGQKLSHSQPIEMRVNEMITGSRADLAVMIYGDEFETLLEKANEVANILQSIPGAQDVSIEQLTGQPMLQIALDYSQLARYGLTAEKVLAVVSAIAGQPIGEIIEGQMRFALVIRPPEQFRQSMEKLSNWPILTETGQQIPLGRLAKLEVIQGPASITRHWGQRRVSVVANVAGRDLGSFVAEAQRRIGREVLLPNPRYRIAYGGQFEHLQRAMQRLWVVVPLALGLIFLLLYLTYHSLIDALRVFTAIPFAWIGGILALWLRDMPFSISAAIGFVAVSGVAVLDDMILVSYIRQLRARGFGVEEAVSQAAQARLRPILMTTIVAALGFVPMATSTGVGAEVQRPLATVVIGGVLMGTLMSLLVVRILYLVFNPQQRPKTPRFEETTELPRSIEAEPAIR